MTLNATIDDLELADALESALSFLSCRQLPSGQFPVEVTFHDREGSPAQLDEALFPTAHIVYSLGFLPHPTAKAMISRALTFLLDEMTGPGLWRYWNKSAQLGTQKLYPIIPADLDVMASICYLLQQHGISFPDNRHLMLLNRNRAGLFYTWLVLRPTPTLNLHYWRTMLADLSILRCAFFYQANEAKYRDVDGVVNANVLFYLGECAETQRIITWLIEIVQQEQEAQCDKWYRDPFTFYYALSRSYHAGVHALEPVRPQVVARLENAAQSDGQIGEHALHTALAVNTLLTFGEHSTLTQNAIGYLLRAQGEDGNWESAPYYYSGPKKAWSWGSDELTTGLCLEALQRFQTRGSIQDERFVTHITPSIKSLSGATATG